MLRATLTLILLTQVCFGMQGKSSNSLNSEGFLTQKESRFAKFLLRKKFAHKNSHSTQKESLEIKQDESQLPPKIIPSHWIRQAVSFDLSALPNEDNENFDLKLMLENGRKKIKRHLNFGPKGYKNSSKSMKWFLDPNLLCKASLSVYLGKEQLRFNSAGNKKSFRLKIKQWPLEEKAHIKLLWNDDQQALFSPLGFQKTSCFTKREPINKEWVLANPFDEIAPSSQSGSLNSSDSDSE